MRANLENIGNRGNRLFSRLAAEKKKTFIALCLIAVMGFMWLRVLSKKTPQSARAALTAQNENVSALRSEPELQVSFIELPEVKGRNDILTKDFFAVDSWQEFMGKREGGNLTGIEEVSVVSKNGSEEIINRVVKKLKLEAIGLGENPRAFINDELLSIGDKLLIRDRAEMYECEVIGIEENAVFIRCGEAKVKLRLTQ